MAHVGVELRPAPWLIRRLFCLVLDNVEFRPASGLYMGYFVLFMTV